MKRTNEDTAHAARTAVRTKNFIESWVVEATKVFKVELCSTESNGRQEVLLLKHSMVVIKSGIYCKLKFIFQRSVTWPPFRSLFICQASGSEPRSKKRGNLLKGKDRRDSEHTVHNVHTLSVG